MIPVKQTHFDNGGNCLAACIASLLHCQLDEIPELGSCNGLEQIFILNQWLRKKGVQYIVFDVPQERIGDFFNIAEDFYYVLHIPVEENRRHAVIGKDGKIVFDPTGYQIVSNFWISLFAKVRIGLIVPIQPWKCL